MSYMSRRSAGLQASGMDVGKSHAVLWSSMRCEIFDASDPTAGPVCRVKLPERISSGTHATWAPASQLN